MTTQTRRTSVYTIRLHAPARGMADRVASGLPVNVTLQDVGGASVSFRYATDDDAALAAAHAAMAGVSREWTLTTGLGIHRREVG